MGVGFQGRCRGRKLGGFGDSVSKVGIFGSAFFRWIFQGKEQGIGLCNRDEPSLVGYEINLGRYFGIKGRACLFFFRVSSG